MSADLWEAQGGGLVPSLPPQHRPCGIQPEQVRRQRNREYDQRRGSARQRGYTAAWDRYAKRYLDEHPLCIGCQAIERVEPATCVDHVVPATVAPELFWDPDNHQGSCDWHHAKVKQVMEQALAKGEARRHDMRLNSSFAIRLMLSMRR